MLQILAIKDRVNKYKIIILNEFVLSLIFFDLNKPEFLYQSMQLLELEKKRKSMTKLHLVLIVK